MFRRIGPLFAGLLVGVGVGAALIFSFFSPSRPPKFSEVIDDSIINAGIAVGNQAPNFELVALSGEKISLEDLRGHPVLINFWATWCGPCRLEMPAFQDRFDQYEGDLQVVAVNFDEPQDDVQAFVDEMELTFDILLDPGAEVQQLYQIRGYPTSFFVDADGIIRVQHIGLIVESQMDEYLVEIGLTP